MFWPPRMPAVVGKEITGSSRKELVGEVADLWFHSMVMLSHLDISVDEVLECLAERAGVSGLEEKAARKS